MRGHVSELFRLDRLIKYSRNLWDHVVYVYTVTTLGVSKYEVAGMTWGPNFDSMDYSCWQDKNLFRTEKDTLPEIRDFILIPV